MMMAFSATILVLLPLVSTLPTSGSGAATTAGDAVYWWPYPTSDCGYDDVDPQPACGKEHKGDVAGLEACCLATSGCGGFNTNGIIKKTDCIQNIKSEPACDLYVKQDHPKPTVNPLYLWPRPASVTSGKSLVKVTPSSSFFSLAGGLQSPLLTYNFERYKSITFPHTSNSMASTPSGITGLMLTVDSLNEAPPTIGTDESYTLDIPIGDGVTANATAKTVFGALRALETFSQLVRFDFETDGYVVDGAPYHIMDAPRFAHRGLMVDTARHYQPLASLRAIIDSLTNAKLNVLHWHMVDDQSFPFQVLSHPKLWSAAYATSQRYTQSDVRSIVEYARLRGVRVMVEFDMPGHGTSWCKGEPSMCPSATCQTPLNVASNYTFQVIDDLLTEAAALFPDDFMHLGGDEVNTQCWDRTPSIAQWMREQSLTADGAYAYFVKKAAAIATSKGKRPVQWSEVFDHFKATLPKNTVVHVWKDDTNVTEVLADGYDVLRNVGYDATSWYLDNLDVTWDAVYRNEPCHDVPDALCHKILGGHGEMWGETVDGSDLQQTVWPKQAAIAEKLWSARADTIGVPDDTEARLLDFRCRLLERGVAAAPVKNAKARSAPPGPGSCYAQRRRPSAVVLTQFCLALTSLLAQVNIAPQTRKERQAALFRDDLEKMRLGQRRESYYVYEEGGVTPQPDSLSYIADADRFVTDGVALNKMERDAAVNKKEQMFYNRRMVRAQNEEVRWRTIETQHQMEQRRLEEMRENHSFARSNKTSMPYNPINLRYDDGHDGERLRYSDESLRYRGALRAEHLQRRMTSTGYDPITGAPIERVHVPEAPKRPGQ